MIRVFCYQDSGQLQSFEGSDILKNFSELATCKLWVDFEAPTDEELMVLTEVFHFSPSAVDDVIQNVGVPKVDFYENHIFMLLNQLHYDLGSGVYERREFEMFASETVVVTIHRDQHSQAFEMLRTIVLENPKQTFGKSPVFILMKMGDLMLRYYFILLQKAQEDLDVLEQRVLSGEQASVLDQILNYKKMISEITKHLVTERSLMKLLHEKESHPVLTPTAKAVLKKVIDWMNDLLHDAELLREHVNSVFEIYAVHVNLKMTESSHQLNYVMQRLTIAATLFLPLTFIVGVYGMNFDYFPELHWRGSYFVLWGVMIGIAAGMLIFFKRRKWI